ncbi:MAG TPA: ATP-grasp domain-containing protein, partial [Clostridiaceae bacterium]|nr:ATP-grasp domain-containing protein [Clostridiaceae bacterium]
KPDYEGSGKGISDLAVVDNRDELDSLVKKNLRLYGEPMLVEEFIMGREFTVGILGNGPDMTVFEPMEICYLSSRREDMIYSYRIKKEYKNYVEYVCPPSLDKEILDKMKNLAATIYTALECRDFSRIDFRLSEDGTVYFIEINPLPGLAPGYSDFPMLAQFCGMDYETLVMNILNSGLKRYNMKPLESRRV